MIFLITINYKTVLELEKVGPIFSICKYVSILTTHKQQHLLIVSLHSDLKLDPSVSYFQPSIGANVTFDSSEYYLNLIAEIVPLKWPSSLNRNRIDCSKCCSLVTGKLCFDLGIVCCLLNLLLYVIW